MEMQVEVETVEPSMTSPDFNKSSRPLPSWPALQARLQRHAMGRLCLGTLQWAVVLALVLTGYFTAAGINSGIQLAVRDGASAHAQQILAASGARK
jgi:hypothetical protein